MKRRCLALLILTGLGIAGCSAGGAGGGEAGVKITKEAASAAGKALRQWQMQNR